MDSDVSGTFHRCRWCRTITCALTWRAWVFCADWAYLLARFRRTTIDFWIIKAISCSCRTYYICSICAWNCCWSTNDLRFHYLRFLNFDYSFFYLSFFNLGFFNLNWKNSFWLWFFRTFSNCSRSSGSFWDDRCLWPSFTSGLVCILGFSWCRTVAPFANFHWFVWFFWFTLIIASSSSWASTIIWNVRFWNRMVWRLWFFFINYIFFWHWILASVCVSYIWIVSNSYNVALPGFIFTTLALGITQEACVSLLVVASLVIISLIARLCFSWSICRLRLGWTRKMRIVCV